MSRHKSLESYNSSSPGLLHHITVPGFSGKTSRKTHAGVKSNRELIQLNCRITCHSRPARQVCQIDSRRRWRRSWECWRSAGWTRRGASGSGSPASPRPAPWAAPSAGRSPAGCPWPGTRTASGVGWDGMGWGGAKQAESQTTCRCVLFSFWLISLLVEYQLGGKGDFHTSALRKTERQRERERRNSQWRKLPRWSPATTCPGHRWLPARRTQGWFSVRRIGPLRNQSGLMLDW